MNIEGTDHINAVRLAADQLTLVCSSIVGPIAATIGASMIKAVGEKVPSEMIDQLVQIERASRRAEDSSDKP